MFFVYIVTCLATSILYFLPFNFWFLMLFKSVLTIDALTAAKDTKSFTSIRHIQSSFLQKESHNITFINFVFLTSTNIYCLVFRLLWQWTTIFQLQYI